MSDEIVHQKVCITVDGKVVAKNVLDLTPAESQRISTAIDNFLFVTRQLNPDFNDDALPAVIERVDASGRPADDSMSYTFANKDLRREARQQFEAEIRAREQASQSIAREARLRADREEYLQPSNRAEVAREFQQNQPGQNPPPKPSGPTREFTDAELDAMSSEEMVRLGIVSRGRRIDEQQGSSGQVFRPENRPDRKNEFRRRKDLMKPLAEILGRKPPRRKIKFSPEELASVERRRRVIAQNEAERRKLQADLERVREEQEEQKWKARNAKKRR